MGDLAEHVVSHVPHLASERPHLSERRQREPAVGLQPPRHVAPQYIALAASGFMEVFKKMWPDAWGVRMEHVLRNVLMALLERPHATMHDILRLLTDENYRKKIVQTIQNQPVRRLFELEFEEFSSRYRADASAPIQNKGRRILGGPRAGPNADSTKTRNSHPSGNG
ncbi:hypothetical protein [Bradyrhizobium sp. USDA 4486]